MRVKYVNKNTALNPVARAVAQKKLAGELLNRIQAASLVAAGVNENKQAVDYMKEISRMDKLIELELKEKLA